MTAAIPHPYPPGEAERFIFRSRADNANGAALVLVITQKGGARPTIGLISATLSAAGEIELGYVLAPTVWGKGFATEAAKALIEIVFGLTRADRILANARTINPASRRVLEKCGFAISIRASTSCRPAAACILATASSSTARPGRKPSSRHLPPMPHQTHDASEVLIRNTQQPRAEALVLGGAGPSALDLE